ncbi:AAA domain-containing protein [Amycolatopsis japonica]|uniref:AAA domain-containing protein n=1 Tax=Amycolatopsis japonica TaxID=208439 RepID=UPI0037904D01
MPLDERGVDVLRMTTSLIDYLADLTDAANRNPVRDITAGTRLAPDLVLWLDEFPPGVALDAEAEQTLLQLPAVRVEPPPTVPEQLVDWVDAADVRSADGPEPKLRPAGNASSSDEDEQEQQIARLQPSFDRWLQRWRAWAAQEPRRRHLRRFYEHLENAAKKIEQLDDEYEFVLATGLVTWQAPDGREIRRHLLTEQIIPALDRTGVISLGRLGGRRRLEDRELFENLEEYRPSRAQAHKTALRESDDPLLTELTASALRDWLALAIDVAWEERASRPIQSSTPTSDLIFSPSPALLLRPRTKTQLSEAYQQIAAELRAPDAEVPVALAQLVVDTERQERETWLDARGATRGNVLGDDPLFPLPANAEQTRVIELLRSETGVVVQGPPGTGKTHTIANLISALLARGQRVLVTSQKDQALRVLREKIPPDLRKLCVLLTGGSRDASAELLKGLDALSAGFALTDERELSSRARVYSAERDILRTESATLNERIRMLRSVELLEHPPVTPGYSSELYRGTLAEIVQETREAFHQHGWIPAVPIGGRDIPPLGPADFAELRRLLASRTPDRTRRAEQVIPDLSLFPSPGDLAGLVHAERNAFDANSESETAVSRQLAALDSDRLGRLESLWQEAWSAFQAAGLDVGDPAAQRAWVWQAARDLLGDKNHGIWGQLWAVRTEPNRLLAALQNLDVGTVVDFRENITPGSLGTARNWLNVAKPLLEYYRGGGKLRRRMPVKAQKGAQPLLDAVRVDGGPPGNEAQLLAAMHRIDAEVSALQLARRWVDLGVPVRATSAVTVLSELADHGAALEAVQRLHEAQQTVIATLAEARIALNVSTPEWLFDAFQAVPAARKRHEYAAAKRQIDLVHAQLTAVAADQSTCLELGTVIAAVSARDPEAYARGLDELRKAQDEQVAEQRCRSLERTLGAIHPNLLRLLERDPDNAEWSNRDLRAAWAWSLADQYVTTQRNADEERRLMAEFDATEDRLKQVTIWLAAIEATRECLRRLTEDQQRALNTYRSHMNKIGAGTGRKTAEFRRAARAAMDKAQGAVPAWVVPLPQLLDNIRPDRDRFDVVIVDEASQVSIEHLYLLWMAPRVIVVGDEKQCTPAASGLGQLDVVFARNDEHLADIAPDIRRVITPKSNLYDVLSARAGKGALVRLREHFRCVPEIITWSSSQFYDDGTGGSALIPLRERKGDSLAPLKVTKVDGATVEGRESRKRNAVEAREIVATLVACLDDPAYTGKSFGVVVLQNVPSHIQLLDHLISESVPVEVRQERGIRVGTAPNFQGDERDVIFLSMVVASTPHVATAEVYRQAYNVAASRAKDQLWLFTSVGLADLRPRDLRTSLLSYMLEPPSVFGCSPTLDEVSESVPTDPFESRFEQRVFREIKKLGYHVVPQYPVGRRTLDLVVAGAGGRIAVECDGHAWHAGIDEQINDARRDRELARMGWRTVRIRESEFTYDPKRELAPLWKALADRGIKPEEHLEDQGAAWTPVALEDEVETLEESSLA